MVAITRNGKVAINGWNGTRDVVDRVFRYTAEKSNRGDHPGSGLCRALRGVGHLYRDLALG